MQTITDWEEIPGIDKVIEQAKRSSNGDGSSKLERWVRRGQSRPERGSRLTYMVFVWGTRFARLGIRNML